MAIRYLYDNNIRIAVYAKKSGVWTKIAETSVPVSGGNFPTGGQRTFSWAVDDTFQLGNGVQAFGLTIVGSDSGTASLTSFTNAKWQAAGAAAGTRSATPNNEQSTITVRPV